MARPDSTCWTVIRGAAAGNAGDREGFATRYASVVRAYLAARWKGSRLEGAVDDALQETFWECFRDGGVLDKADPVRPGGFRAFLYGVVRNVAMRFEKKAAQARERQMPSDVDEDSFRPPDENGLSAVFDRAWARTVMKEAAEIQARAAARKGEGAERRVEILRLRFQEDLPIREIAARWGLDPAFVHHEYAQARGEFRAALEEVLAFYDPDSGDQAGRECAALLALLA